MQPVGLPNAGKVEAVIRIVMSPHRIGLLMAAPLVLIALVLAGIATWDARPLPACSAGRIDPLNPVYRCRQVTMIAGAPVQTVGVTGPGLVRMVEQGSVSGMPDFRSAGLAVLGALGLYGLSRGLGWLVRRRRRWLARQGPTSHLGR
jgi:hypothetical protein